MKKKKQVPDNLQRQKKFSSKRMDKKREPTFRETVGAYIKFIVLLGILVMPVIVLILPNYWQNFFLAPKFYFSTIVFFFLPICTILARPIWRNPFFLAPFSISFVLSSQITHYLTFLFIYWFFIGSILTLFAFRRTKPPYRSLELQLYLTSYFIDYFEVRYYWRIIILLLGPILIPGAFFLFNFFI